MNDSEKVLQNFPIENAVWWETLASLKFGEPVIRIWQLQALVHSAIVHEIILADFKFGYLPIHQIKIFAKVSCYTVGSVLLTP